MPPPGQLKVLPLVGVGQRRRALDAAAPGPAPDNEQSAYADADDHDGDTTTLATSLEPGPLVWLGAGVAIGAVVAWALSRVGGVATAAATVDPIASQSAAVKRALAEAASNGTGPI